MTGRRKPFRSRLRTWVLNGLTVAASLAVCTLLFEFVVFRLVLPASRVPRLAFVDGIIKYEPDQHGLYRVKDEIRAEFRINAAGWNSGHASYALPETEGLCRVALIGDSYVEAFQVDYDESVAERLERALGAATTQVFRFGIGGAPLSQYLHMLRREVSPYQPDVVVVVVVHNDFSESYSFAPGVFTSSFLKLDLSERSVEELEPRPYRKPWYDPIRNSATWRYLAVNRKIRFQTLRNLILGKGEVPAGSYQANIDISKLDKQMPSNRLAAEHVLSGMRDEVERYGGRLLVVIDGDRHGIQSGEVRDGGALRLNGLLEQVAASLGVGFVDLHPVFREEYRLRRERLLFPSDGHWTAAAHDAAARAIAERLSTLGACDAQGLEATNRL